MGVSALREREVLAREGLFLVNLFLDKNTGRLVEEPEVLTRGFPFSEDKIADARRRIAEAVTRGNGNLQDDIQQMIKSYLYNETKRRPTVFVTLSRS